MKNAISIIRVSLYVIFSFFMMEWLVDSGDQLAIVKYPIIWAVLGIILFLAITFEVVNSSFKRVLFETLDKDAKERYISKYGDDSLIHWYQRVMGAKSIENEEEIALDHVYDGIRELDNVLPPWWKYLFYATIVFAVVYLVRYEVLDGINQVQEYELAVAKAEKEIAEYRANNKDLINADNVELLTDASDLAAGKDIFENSCAACHKSSGAGGIGPNLTDDYWILGGGIKNIFNTVSEGGRPGKGMIPWKTELNPMEIAQVSSYVITLHGTNPADGKEPEGDLWTEE